MVVIEWEFFKGSVKVEGEWGYLWDQLLIKDELSLNSLPINDYMVIPSNWDAFEINGEKLPIKGYATYRLTVLLPVSEGTYGIKTSNIRASNRIYVNGKTIGASGEPATSEAETILGNTPFVGYFE